VQAHCYHSATAALPPRHYLELCDRQVVVQHYREKLIALQRNSQILSISVLSNFSLLKLFVAVCEVAIMKECTEVLFEDICRGERDSSCY
jgi:hypothetical protein